MSETSITSQQYKKEILKYVIDKVNTFYQNESISFEVKLLLVPEDNSFKASKYGKYYFYCETLFQRAENLYLTFFC